MATPRPWLPSCGLTTTGTPISQAAAPGVFGVVDRPAVGRGHAHGAEQHAGHFLVLGDRLGDGAGAIGLGGLDAALLPAVAEEHQAVVVQPAIGNAAGLRRLRRWPACSGPRHTSWARLRSRSISRGDVEGPIVDGRQAQFAGDGQALAAHRLVDVLDDDPVDALSPKFRGPCRNRRRCRPAFAVPA